MKGKSQPKKITKKAPRARQHLPKDLQEMEHDELSGYDSHESSLAASATDDNEDEGVGDGNMGTDRESILEK